jgi:beta-galactosidase
VDGQPIGTLERESEETVLSLRSPAPNARLSILVENQGRVNYGPRLRDWKGIAGPVTFKGDTLAGWTATALPLTALDGLSYGGEDIEPGPAFHRGTFDVPQVADSFLHLPGWSKGNAWINGFALGRYWSRGPQRSLYVPGPVLREGANEIVLLELHGVGDPVAHLRQTADLGFPE